MENETAGIELTREQAVELLTFLKDEVSDTFAEAIAAFSETGRIKIDPSDLTDSVLDLVGLALQAFSAGNPLIMAAVTTMWPILTNMIVGAVQKAEDRGMEPGTLIRKIARAEANAEKATARADKLSQSEKREVFEAVRIYASRRRARNQLARARELKALLSTADGQP